MVSGSSKRPLSVTRAIIALWLLAVVALAWDALRRITGGPATPMVGCSASAILFAAVLPSGLSRGYRGSLVLAVGGGALAFLMGLLLLTIAIMPIPDISHGIAAVFGLAFVATGVAPIWLLVGPRESRAWFRPK